MEDDNPEDFYGLQEVVGESEDRPPLEVVDLTAETKVPMDQAEDVSGMLQKFRSFCPISLIFLNLCSVILFCSPSLR